MSLLGMDKLTVPEDTVIGSGWILAQLDGQEAFTDGAAIFAGPPPKGETCQLKNGEAVIAEQLKNAQLQRPLPTELFTIKKSDDGLNLVFLKSSEKKETAIQKKYYDFVLMSFPEANLCLGKKIKGGYGRYVLATEGDKVVAIINPVRTG